MIILDIRNAEVLSEQIVTCTVLRHCLRPLSTTHAFLNSLAEFREDDEVDGEGGIDQLLDQETEGPSSSLSLRPPPLSTKRRVLPLMVLGQGLVQAFDLFSPVID